MSDNPISWSDFRYFLGRIILSYSVERHASPDSEPAAGEEYGGGAGSTLILILSPRVPVFLECPISLKFPNHLFDPAAVRIDQTNDAWRFPCKD